VTEQAWRRLQMLRARRQGALDPAARRLPRGELLWTESGPHFVDLDDARMGPALQDLWMLLSGDRRAMTQQLSDLLAAYEDFMPFDRRELASARSAGAR